MATAALICLSCAATAERQPPLHAPANVTSILNLRIVSSAGPSLGDYGDLIEPSGAALDGLGELFITDRIANTIHKISPELLPLAREGGIGGYAGGFNQPADLACDAAMNVYVADTGNRRIQVLDRNLRIVHTIENYSDENGEPVDFVVPRAIAIDYEGNFWISDDDRVLKLDPFFRLLFAVSEKVPGYFILGRVSSIDVSRSGTVAIADAGNHRIVLINVYGNYVGWFDAGSPAGVSWDKNNLLWVADPDARRLSAYNIGGELIYVHVPEQSGSRPNEVACDPGGGLFMIDKGLRRIWSYDIIRGGSPEITR